MPPGPRHARSGAGSVRRFAMAGACALLLWVPTALFGPASPAAAFPTPTVTIIGHGFGHGIGMGQWGSLGYALGQDDNEGNFTYQQILSHYYGNTTMQTVDDSTAMHGGEVLVAMTEADGIDTIVSAGDAGAVVNSPGASAPALRFQQVSANTFQIDTGPGCAGPWSPPVASFINPTASASDGGPVNLCTPRDTAKVHGTLTAVTNSAGASRTVNAVPIEQYVADVAPSESPASWSTLGGPGPQGLSWGFQQSEAQTVAARSYVESTPLGFGGYADTCDLTCQFYPGMVDETLSSIAAALDTAGQVMVVNGTSAVATTEYSSSSGGWSAGAPFPAARDDGDAICITGACNPHHTWTVSIPVLAVEAAYPQIGSLSAIAVTARNGLGDLGGRVERMTITGSSGSVSVTGNAFAAALNLQSNWFSVGGAPPPPGPPSGGVGGYWISGADGGVFSFGNAPFHGSMGNVRLNRPVVGIAATHDAGGYWEVASDGGVFSFGDALFHGSTGNLVLNQPVVGMARTPDGGGYWLVASDGGVFSFGDAAFHGSTGNLVLNRPVVGMVPTPDGGGYWLVASDGGVFSFGDAPFHGSLGASPPPTPIVGVAPTRDGGGYWMLEADGVAHAFGDAPALGPGPLSPGLAGRGSPMSALTPDLTGHGFDAVDTGGQAFAYGDAPYLGDVTTVVSNYSGSAVGIAVHPG